MARRLLLLVSIAAAGAALAACDNPAAGILSTAEKGQCFAVTGKDNLGQPKLIRTDCAAPGSITAPPAAVAATPAKTCARPVLPVVQPCGPGATHQVSGAGLTYQAAKARHSARQSARVVRKAVRRKGTVHYEYVPAGGEVFHSSSSYAYARPSDTTELAGGYSYHREEAHVAPPPPPPPTPAPPAYVYGRDSRSYDTRAYDGRAYESHSSESRSYASQSSSSSGYASSSQSSRRKSCNCSRDRRPVVVEQYERDGYLTWPGKSRY